MFERRAHTGQRRHGGACDWRIVVANHQHIFRHAKPKRVQRHHHAERDRIVGTHHGLRLHERLGKQSHGAVESALHATVSELVPFGFGGKMVRSHLRVEHGEQFRRFEGDFLAGHVCHGCDATFGQMPDHDFHGGVFVDAHHGCAG